MCSKKFSLAFAIPPNTMLSRTLFFTAVLTLVILLAAVRGEGRTWLSHHGGLPPPKPSNTRRTTAEATGKPSKVQPVQRVIQTRARIPKNKNKTIGNSHKGFGNDSQSDDEDKYAYAAGAFGFEPELGIH